MKQYKEKHTNIISKKCYKCGHDKFFSKNGVQKCSRCGSPPTKLVSYKNKHRELRTKVVLDGI